MHTRNTGDGADGEPLAGLLVEDDSGRYFLIAWDELRRFHVPEAYHETLTALVRGGEAPGGAAVPRGRAAGPPAFGADTLLDEVVSRGIAAPGRLAARRLSVWALLR
jgi:hypothetical protein